MVRFSCFQNSTTAELMQMGQQKKRGKKVLECVGTERFERRLQGFCFQLAYDDISELQASFMIQLYIPKHLETSYDKGFMYTDGSNNTYRLYSYEIGILKITEGSIVACDPFLYNNDLPFTTRFPVGQFPVQLAVAQINDDERVAFSRIKFSNEIPVTWTLAVCEGQDISKLDENEIFGYGVDAGTGAFMDISGAREFMKFLTEKENNFQLLIDEMEKHYKHTWDWLMWEKNDTNVAMFKSGWGDGFYATYIGYDRNGSICRLVTDFAVMD